VIHLIIWYWDFHYWLSSLRIITKIWIIFTLLISWKSVVRELFRNRSTRDPVSWQRAYFFLSRCSGSLNLNDTIVSKLSPSAVLALLDDIWQLEQCCQMLETQIHTFLSQNSQNSHIEI
jgi:hypothetical protein